MTCYAHRRFRAADGIDLQHIEKGKADRFTEFTFLFYIWLNAERFTESLKLKRNDLQESAQALELPLADGKKLPSFLARPFQFDIQG